MNKNIDFVEVLSKAVGGDTEGLEATITTLIQERDNLLALANERIARLSGQVEMLQLILKELQDKHKK